MKTTLEIPDDLFRRTKAMAALRGESMKDFVTEALQAHLERPAPEASSVTGWRSVFGKARKEDVEAVDAIIAAELERVDPEDWQ
jgi:hypothetical protein